MNDTRDRRGPNPALLLLIPVAVMLVKGSHRRRAMEAFAGEPGSGAAGHGYGHHSRFWGGGTEADGHGAFPLPPRIERVLDAWHARAHAPAEPTEPTTA